jgi:crotonobetainyl-CoA:carnitine CoA-transferase CaiB-like acyl-CoA transferase
LNDFLDELPQFGPDSDELKRRLSTIFAQKTREEWMIEFGANPDACVMPVLDLGEAPLDPHNRERGSFVVNSQGKFEPVMTFCMSSILLNLFRTFFDAYTV